MKVCFSPDMENESENFEWKSAEMCLNWCLYTSCVMGVPEITSG